MKFIGFGGFIGKCLTFILCSAGLPLVEQQTTLFWSLPKEIHGIGMRLSSLLKEIQGIGMLLSNRGLELLKLDLAISLRTYF